MRTTELRAILSQIAGPHIGNNRPQHMVDGLNTYVAVPALFPDERELLEEVCKLIDAENDSNSAWKMINNLDET